MAPTDITAMGALHLKGLETVTVGGSYMGDGVEAPLIIDSRDKSTAANNDLNKIELALTYKLAGLGSTVLSTKEYGTTGSSGGTANTVDNLTISGVKDPTINSGLATKNYVDTQSTNIFQVHEEVKATSTVAFTLVYAANDASGDPNASTISFNANTATGLWADGNTINTDVRCDDVLLTPGKRVFVTKSGGGSVDAKSDGIYVITSITGDGSYTVLLTRANDAKDFTDGPSSQFTKGEFVVTASGGTLNAGKGYFLSAKVTDPDNAQAWYQFSSHNLISFTSPIEIRQYAGIGKWTIAGEDDNTEIGLVITGGDNNSNGLCDVTPSFGKTDGALTIIGSSNVINGSGLSTYIAAILNIVSIRLDFSSSVSIALDASGGTMKTWACKNHFSKTAGGTPVVTGAGTVGEQTAVDVRIEGHVAPTSAVFAPLVESWGSGVFFDQKTDYAGTNSNRGKFLMTQRNDALDNVATLDIIGFANGASGAAVTIAQIIP